MIVVIIIIIIIFVIVAVVIIIIMIVIVIVIGTFITSFFSVSSEEIIGKRFPPPSHIQIIIGYKKNVQYSVVVVLGGGCTQKLSKFGEK